MKRLTHWSELSH